MSELELEIAALDAIRVALEPLDPIARKRALSWADNRYGITTDLADTFQKWLLSLIQAVGEHAAQNENPTEAEKKLYRVLDGTRWALKIPPPSSVGVQS